MSPTIKPGDVVVTVSAAPKSPRRGDIVTYQARRFDGTPVATFTHRIIQGNSRTGFVVKGDANKSPDIQKPSLKDILGVVIFTVPWIGKLFNPKVLFMSFFVLFGTWLIWEEIREKN
jgi:signal peptidase